MKSKSVYTLDREYQTYTYLAYYTVTSTRQANGAIEAARISWKGGK
jgi:hypothetical protein